MSQSQAQSGHRSPVFRILLLIVLGATVIGAWLMAGYVIEIAWWKEVGQFNTWLKMLTYSVTPVALATLVAFLALWISHARALKFAGTGLGQHRLYARASSLFLLFFSWMIASGAIDTWTVVRYAGSRGLPAAATAWRDVVFGQPLSFYLFDLPFYSLLRGYLLALVIACIVVYWLAGRGWQLRAKLEELRDARELDPHVLRLEGGLESRFLRGAVAVLLIALALRYYLGRFEMVYNEHGSFLVGIDYVDSHFGLPLQWLVIVACLAAAVFVCVGRWRLAALMSLALVADFVIPGLVGALYVRPNEISLQRDYIKAHIHATRNAYGIESGFREVEFKAHPEAPIDAAAHRPILDNLRLWDTQAFHDTVTQIQALRPYYVFNDTDVDRYTIDGQYRQVLLAPRELDLRQLPAAQANWINPAFIYTHGYGVVLAPVSQITSDGLPSLLIQNAPPESHTASLKLTRPEIYFGEVSHEPVFVHTAREEFNYPSGEANVSSRYEGKGGFPISSFGMRLMAAINEGEPNILLTGYLTANSHMMIHRRVPDRLNQLAGFLKWDEDPYMVIADDGRLVWMVDGYTTSDAHPYSRSVDPRGLGHVNYIRNAVKATIDAYDGTTRLYVFAPDDPLISAYRRLFPDLFLDAAQMPADLRRHARYPETLFRVQAEVYRTYHMLDPQSFYNKEDLWDLAKHSQQANSGEGREAAEPVTPTYVVTTLPGEVKPEFLLMTEFTPRGKDNLIGVMAARCDGEHLGQMVVLQLSKQELIFGPMQIGARINQDQNISKDLSLWNQKGSTVHRGQILVLPVGDTFLYVDRIYIQADQAKMPQLKKVVLAVGNRLIYADTYEEALSQLTQGARDLIAKSSAPENRSAASVPAAAGDSRVQQVREHLKRYRDLAAQGRWADAGKELEAIEAAVK